jgi:predicted nucleic acid-binding protein
MKVVLDANIIIADFWLETTNFKLLFESAKKGDIKIYIPEVVVDEVVNKYNKRLEESKEKIESELKTFNKVSKLNQSSSITKSIIDRSVLDYKNHLQKVIKENTIEIIDYPKTDHKTIALKAINKYKPFNTNEKGYRDCLIWENIKQLLTESESAISQPELVFISNNYKDFATNEYELHPGLISELENEDYDSKSVIIYPSLSEFNDKQTKLFFTQSKSFEKKLKQKELGNFDLHSVIINYLYNKYVGSELFNYDMDFEYDSSEPTVSSIYEDFEEKIISVKKLNASDFLVDVEFEVNTQIDFFIEKSEYWSMGDDKKHISIQDSDWNDWVMLAETESSVPLSMTLIIDDDLNVKSCQIDKINKNYAQHFV